MDRACKLAALGKAAPAPIRWWVRVVLPPDGTLVGRLPTPEPAAPQPEGGVALGPGGGERGCGGTLVVKPGALLPTTAGTPPLAVRR